MNEELRLVNVAEMQAIEREANDLGLTYELMMEYAGRGIGQIVDTEYSKYRGSLVLGIVGSGNNGGDTLVALEYLLQRGWRGGAYIVKERPSIDPLVDRVKKAGGNVISTDPDYIVLEKLIREAKFILDGVFGTGIKLPLREKPQEILKKIGELVKKIEVPPIVIAVDCPSGVDCDSGDVPQEVMPATVTITMAAVKEGLLKFPAALVSGSLRVVGIGLTDDIKAWKSINRYVLDRNWVMNKLPKRPLDAHKGTFGTTVIVAGSENYTGAPLLAGNAAYLSGSGLVTLAVPQPLHQVIAGHLPEATWILLPSDEGFIASHAVEMLLTNLERATSLLIGPGFGLHDSTKEFLRSLFRIDVKRKVIYTQNIDNKYKFPPLILDADGLKLVSQFTDWYRYIPSNTIITPHPGEMAILTGLSVKEIQKDRLTIASKYANIWNVVLVLKGAHTIIAEPHGRIAVVPIATPALARAGSGDVLAGLIAGFVAQGVNSFEASAMGAWMHAQSGLIMEKTIGSSACVLAGDLLTGIIEVMKDFEK